METNTRRVTTLIILAKEQYGGIERLAQLLGLSGNTLWRAARGEKVSESTQRLIRTAFGGNISFADLQKPVASIFEHHARKYSRSKRDPALVVRHPRAKEYNTPAGWAKRREIKEAESEKLAASRRHHPERKD